VVSLSVQATLDSRTLWIVVPLVVGERSIRMVLDSGSPIAAVSRPTLDLLLTDGRVDPADGPNYMLRSPTIQGQLIPDLRVCLSRHVTRAGADGMLGLNFFGQFTDVHCHVPTLRFTFSGP
jgi:hypothetical protein